MLQRLKSFAGAVLAAVLLGLSPGAGFHEALASGFLRKEAAAGSRGRTERSVLDPGPLVDIADIRSFELPGARPEPESTLSPSELGEEWQGLQNSVGDLARAEGAPAFGAGRAIEAFLTRARPAGAIAAFDLAAEAELAPLLSPRGSWEGPEPGDIRGPPSPSAERSYRSETRRASARTWAALSAMALIAGSAMAPIAGWASAALAGPGLAELAGAVGKLWLEIRGEAARPDEFEAAVVLAFFALPLLVGLLFPKQGRTAAAPAPGSGHPGLLRAAEALSSRAGFPPPDVQVLESPSPGAQLAWGRGAAFARNGKLKVSFTEGILRLLDRGQAIGVLAHELAHLRNGDARFVRVAKSLSKAASVAVAVSGMGSAMSLPAVWAAILSVVLLEAYVLRVRERLADATAAALFVPPGALASSLVFLDVYGILSPGLVPPLRGGALASLFQEHPPTLNRVEALRRLEEPRAPAAASNRDRGAWSLLLFHASLSLGLASMVSAVGALFGMRAFPFGLLLLLTFAAFAAALAFSRLYGKRDEGAAIAEGDLLAYLEHPDAAVRRWAGEALSLLAPGIRSQPHREAAGRAFGPRFRDPALLQWRHDP